MSEVEDYIRERIREGLAAQIAANSCPTCHLLMLPEADEPIVVGSPLWCFICGYRSTYRKAEETK